jgi:polypeptide N-acetylgalactosaminyltransferase
VPLAGGPGADLAAELQTHGFHLRLSDSLPLDREVPDARDERCRAVQPAGPALAALPTTTVVMVFHNEALSMLLRSVHSVLNRSPPALLLEILLVDDGSDRAELGAPLAQAVAALPKVALLRQPRRMGLVQARLRGAREAAGETVTVLDSHVEVQPGWLEPLMARLAGHPERVVMPLIDSTDPATLVPAAGGIGATLGFLWTLTEHSIDIQRKVRSWPPRC